MLTQLLPRRRAEVDPLELYLAADRPIPDERPWVALGMVSAADGPSAVAGVSGPLGGPADKEVFRAVRACADVVLVGAGTVRADRYGPVHLSDQARQRRVVHGRSPEPPGLVVVSARLDLDWEAALFTGSRPPLVVTVEDAEPSRRRRAEQSAEVWAIGRRRVDIPRLLTALRERAEVVVCEGGPSLNGAIVDQDLHDELCLSIAPSLVGGDSSRKVVGAGERERPLRLASLLTDGNGALFCRYLRRDPR